MRRNSLSASRVISSRWCKERSSIKSCWRCAWDRLGRGRIKRSCASLQRGRRILLGFCCCGRGAALQLPDPPVRVLAFAAFGSCSRHELSVALSAVFRRERFTQSELLAELFRNFVELVVLLSSQPAQSLISESCPDEPRSAETS